MFYGARYDTCRSAIYVFKYTIILKLKCFVVNNALFYYILVCVCMERPDVSEVLESTTKQLIYNICFYTK